MASTGITDIEIDRVLNRGYTDTFTETIPSQFKIGKGTTDFDPTDTDLEDPVPINGSEQVDDCDATAGWAAGTDTLVALNASVFIQGTGSLSMAKTGTAGTSASMDKTTPSLDFTSKAFCIFVRITALADFVAAGTAVTVRFGSDSGNYYEFAVPIGNLTTGWNFITFTTATATSTTGAPVIGACDYTYIAYHTDLAADTVAANRFLVDDIKLASADDYFKALDSVTVDTANDEVVMESRVVTTEANGILLSESGPFNSDGTPLLVTRSTFDGFSKTLDDELILTDKIKFRRQ